MKPLDNENGTVLIFATLMIVLLLIMVGMGLDTGHLVYIRSQGQPAVDAAARAPASPKPTGNFYNHPARNSHGKFVYRTDARRFNKSRRNEPRLW